MILCWDELECNTFHLYDENISHPNIHWGSGVLISQRNWSKGSFPQLAECPLRLRKQPVGLLTDCTVSSKRDPPSTQQSWAEARARASTVCCAHDSQGKVPQIPVLAQRLTLIKKFRVQYSKPTHLTDPRVSSGMNQYQFRLYLNILFKYSLSLLMLGWEVQSFKYTLSYTEIFFHLGTTWKHMNTELNAQIP